MIPCMGGWCQHRESCALYHAEDRSLAADRRLCAKGEEKPVLIRPRETIEKSNHAGGGDAAQ